MKYCKHSFTLIEMLVVMGIMGALITVMLPSFNRMINGNKVDQMTSNIKLGLERAQSLAVTSRRHIAVIFPNNTGKWDDDEKTYCFGGYRLAVVDYVSGNNSCDFVQWVPGSVWKNEPRGALLTGVIDKAAVDGLADQEWTQGVKDYAKTTAEDLGAANLLYNVKKYNGTSEKGNCAIVFSPYGGIVNPMLGLVIAEGFANGNDLVYPTKINSNPGNFLILGVNKFSGRVEYKQ